MEIIILDYKRGLLVTLLKDGGGRSGKKKIPLSVTIFYNRGIQHTQQIRIQTILHVQHGEYLKMTMANQTLFC